MNLKELTDQVISGKKISKEEALFLYRQPLLELCGSADKIRKYFCSDQFDICTIINAKSGSCSENCKFCAQSAHNHTCAATYPLLSKEEILAQAKINHEQGVLRYSIVTSGKRLSDAEVDLMCEVVREIKEKIGISYASLRNRPPKPDEPYRNKFCVIRKGVLEAIPTNRGQRNKDEDGNK